jgi:two-component system, LytTR family, response regulator LytT
MTVLIVEDEQLAQERLEILVKAYDPSITIAGKLESVDEAVNWLNTKPHPDIILLDIHLADGDSFEIFKRTTTQKPIIFTTAYENYAIDAFQLFSIDYILKPVTAQSLAAALNKYKNLSAVFTPHNYELLVEQVKDNFLNNYKTRFLAKVGQRLFLVQADEVAFFSADNKIVFLTDRDGNRFVINATIDKLENELNPKNFFRVNRSTIIHAGVLEQIKPYPSNRLKLQLKNIAAAEEIIISRERVQAFKEWAGAW